MSEFDEKAELKTLQREAVRLAAAFTNISKIKTNDTEMLDRLHRAVGALPAGESYGSAIEEFRIKITEYIKKTQQSRRESFGRIEAEFIRTAREKGKPIREQASGWRIGPLEIEVQKENSRVRFLYNREVVLPWKSVNSKEDIDKLEASALSMLEKAKLPEDLMSYAFWNAYQYVKEQRQKSKVSNAELVPIGEFYRELRAQLVRAQLQGKRPGSKLAYTEMPTWAFLYNLDRYRAVREMMTNQRLGFQTGSQVEVARGMGMTVNGIDSRQDYKTICYVMSSGS